MSQKNLIQVHTFYNRSYQEIWDFQSILLQKLIQNKRFNEKNKQNYTQVHHLIFCEHNPVYTLGKSGKEAHLLLNDNSLKEANIEYFKINRGGDITYHGPGQWTVYPILDMECFYRDIHRYIRSLENMIIKILQQYNLRGKAIEEYTGVWFKDNAGERKICAIGVHMSRWVSMHGLAFNVNTDLDYFNKIIPCGIRDDIKSVTSLSKELGRNVEMEEIKNQIIAEFVKEFDVEVLNNNLQL